MENLISRRGFAQASMLAAVAAGVPVTAMAATDGAGPPHSSGPSNMSPAVEKAWRNYQKALEDTREYLYSRRYSESEVVKNQANQLLMQAQSATYNMVLAPRVDYPRFYVNTIFEPMVGTWLGPCPDFIYRWAYIDGTQTYRIWGKRSASRFLDIQLSPWIGAVDYEQYKKLPSSPYPIDDMHLESDGSFEIIASPDKQDGNWIKLDPNQDRMALFVREGLYDWTNERPSLLRIERVATTPPRPIQYDEAEFIKYMEHAARFIKIIIADLGVDAFDYALKSAGNKTNNLVYADLGQSSGGNHNAAYCNMAYEIAPDEALIVEFDAPSSKYWGICLMDRYLQTTDFTYHQSSLNGHQAKRDRDGKYRFVLTQKDPGIANWLDPVGVVPIGYFLFRQYFQARRVDLPVVSKVKFADIHRMLPADTARVSPTERERILRDRSWASLGLYGY